MALLIAGFEYDIFISYRHNDNRSGWVTEFVKALQEELASTIKEPLSIYFDQNPHDGLLETHNVDKSLEGKLKCLIFIPIISQTYCDTKSFAWQHEFVAFNKMAQEDSLGRDITLSNGNVTSRILPIKIHDLDAEDKSTIENEIGGLLRAIEFIYKETGVNRPLKPNDSKTDNQNKTDYRNQVNKVANAIKELINSLKNPITRTQKQATSNKTTPKKSTNTKSFLVIGASIILLTVAGYFLYQKVFLTNKETELLDKSIAVLPFVDLSEQKDQEWFSDGLTEEILNSLTNLNELKVTARTSSFHFKGKDVSLKEIAKQLGVAHIVEGSVQRINNKLRITAQLIRTSDEFHIWSKTYDRTSDDLFKVQTDIAENIARALLKKLTPEKQAQLVTTKPSTVEAYEYFLRGLKIHEKYWGSFDNKDFAESERYFLKAISLDPAYAENYGALGDLYDTRGNNLVYRKKFWHLRDSVMQIGYRLNPNSIQALMTYTLSFLKREQPDFDSAYYYTKKMYTLSPNEVLTNLAVGDFYLEIGMNEIAKKFYLRAINIDPLNENCLSQLGLCYFQHGNYQESKKAFEKILELDNEVVPHFWLGYYAIFNGDRSNAEHHLEAMSKIGSRPASVSSLKSILLASEGDKEAIKLDRNNNFVLSILGMKKEFLQKLDSSSKVINPRVDPVFLLNNPLCDFVKNEPEFKIILERVRNDYAEKLKRFPELD